ncbi:hypothetical protein MBGDN05_00178 [Thermoplasmatales archaeon SCGC AB-539-N05]|nr:hypothetical protein MBGDN05_00178 [Thermoplasmatales archaeon SCGC AB-539-N05]
MKIQMRKNRFISIIILLISILSIIAAATALKTGFYIRIDNAAYAFLILSVILSILIIVVLLKVLIKNIRFHNKELQRKIDNINDYYQYEVMMNPPKMDT